MKQRKLYSLEELGSYKRRIVGSRRPRFHKVQGVPVKDSVEYRILMKKKEIAAMDAEYELTHPKPVVLKQAIAITLFGVTKYYRIEDKEAIIASNIGHTIVEIEEQTQTIRFEF